MGARILVVDDESNLLLTIVANLELAGIEVVGAENGAEALALFEAQPFDLVLTDVRMPGMSGVELFRRLRELRPETPVVLMTAYAVEHLIEEAMAEGVFAVLRKPFDIDRAIPMLLKASGRPLVLVVDDEARQAETAAAALCENGVRAKAVFDGESAVREVQSGNIDVCIVDLVMPGVDGAEVVRRIATIDPTIVCIAISGHDVPELVRRVVAAGAFACLRKPVPIPDLARQIATARAKGVQ